MVSLAVPTSEAQPSVLVPETKHPFFKGLTVWLCWNYKLPRIHVKKSIVKSSCLLIFIPKTSTSCPPFWRSCIMFHLALWQFDWGPCNNSPLNLAFLDTPAPNHATNSWDGDTPFRSMVVASFFGSKKPRIKSPPLLAKIQEEGGSLLEFWWACPGSRSLLHT